MNSFFVVLIALFFVLVHSAEESVYVSKIRYDGADCTDRALPFFYYWGECNRNTGFWSSRYFYKDGKVIQQVIRNAGFIVRPFCDPDAQSFTFEWELDKCYNPSDVDFDQEQSPFETFSFRWRKNDLNDVKNGFMLSRPFEVGCDFWDGSPHNSVIKEGDDRDQSSRTIIDTITEGSTSFSSSECKFMNKEPSIINRAWKVGNTTTVCESRQCTNSIQDYTCNEIDLSIENACVVLTGERGYVLNQRNSVGPVFPNVPISDPNGSERAFILSFGVIFLYFLQPW